MGVSQSSSVGITSDKSYQVIKVDPSSPGELCGLCAKDDFVIKMNGTPINILSSADIKKLIHHSVNRPIVLTVYSTKTTHFREVKLTPSLQWPGSGLVGIQLKLVASEDTPEELLSTEVEFQSRSKSSDSSDEHHQHGGISFMSSRSISNEVKKTKPQKQKYCL
mmetsp:Transcript_67803/g.133375  ORF Transcript_67803/g.133375 Transcript_67803/m.133375 type:complete len:164 (+) Transcript_67803:69-560(+)